MWKRDRAIAQGLIPLWIFAAGCSDETQEPTAGDCCVVDAEAMSPDTGAVGHDAGNLLDAGMGTPTHDQVREWVLAYKSAHPGGDWDINAKTPTQLASDPDAQRLLSLCGEHQRPVYPLLAWEYGGSDHPWISPEESALLYCVYTPVDPSTEHWSYDATSDHVIADVYVGFPDDNPCKTEVGRDQVAACIGDPTNFEILVDTANYHDGVEAGLALAEASTDLMLILEDGSKVLLAQDF